MNRRRGRPYVYFVRRADGEGPVKIGCSEHPESRLCTLMCWAPYPLAVVARIPGDETVEQRFHALFAADHSHREWFRPSAQLEAVILRVAAGAFDLAELPPPKRLPYARTKGWSELSVARLYATRALERLAKAGVPIPANINEGGFGFYRVPDEDGWRILAPLQEFLAGHDVHPKALLRPSGESRAA